MKQVNSSLLVEYEVFICLREKFRKEETFDFELVLSMIRRDLEVFPVWFLWRISEIYYISRYIRVFLI